MLKNIIVKENINNGRQFELDIARGLAVLFMVIVHVLSAFSKEEVSNSTFGFVIDFLGSPPAAPVFMFILGTGLVYSTKSEAVQLFKRGIYILSLGYLLNFLRGGLPTFTQLILDGDKELLGDIYEHMFSVDILQFAGASFLFFAYIKKFKISNLGLLLIGLFCTILNLFLLKIRIDHPALSAVTGLVWGSNGNTFFPFLSWIMYPITGYLFASILKKCRDKKTLYFKILLISGVLLLLFSILFIYVMKIDLGFDDGEKYFHQTIPGNLIMISFTLFWVSSIYFVSKPLKGLMQKTITRWSKNVLSIYMIHWIIIGWASLLIYNRGYILTIIIMGTLMVVSDFTASILIGNKVVK